MTQRECVELLASTIEYNIRRYVTEGDDEGARLQSLTLARVRDALTRQLWIVRQYPKSKYRDGLVSLTGIYEAKSGAEAIRLALANDKDNDFGFNISSDYCKPSASLFVLGEAHRS